MCARVTLELGNLLNQRGIQSRAPPRARGETEKHGSRPTRPGDPSRRVLAWCLLWTKPGKVKYDRSQIPISRKAILSYHGSDRDVRGRSSCGVFSLVDVGQADWA